MSVSGTTATFSVAQTGNIGVGDQVIYGTPNQTAYISGKLATDKTQWSLVTAIGTTPVATTTVSVTSIKHAYATLYSAFSGAVNASHMNSSDLVASNYVLNIPCYYDSGPDYTTAYVSTASWNQYYNTGPSNYINVYTPVSTSTEANASQRHTGMWTNNAYTMSGATLTLGIGAKYVRVSGIQFTSTTTSTTFSNTITVGTTTDSFIVLNDNIVRGQVSGSATSTADGINIGWTSSPTVAVTNNIIYGYDRGIQTTGVTYAYNNTVYDTNTGYYVANNGGYVGTLYAKNNIAQNSNRLSNSKGYIAAGTGSFDPSSTNNLSDKNDAPGTNPLNAKTVSFVNTNLNNFHLSVVDTTAKDQGINLSADAHYPFTIDVDSQSRPYGSAWDIGADEWLPPTSGTGPTITFAMPSTASSPIVPVTTFTAASNSQGSIVGYLINESLTTPTYSAFIATSSLPVYAFSGTGTRTAYAWTLDGLGNISSSTASVIITPSSDPSTFVGSQISSTFFGLHTAYRSSGAQNDSRFLNWPSLPFGATRIWDNAYSGWGYIEPSRGIYSWLPLDSYTEQAHANGQDSVYVMAYTPQWASMRPTESCDNAVSYIGCDAPPSDVGSGDQYWKEFVTALVQHSLADPKHYIKYYEIWNEPNLTQFWTGNNVQLATMARDAYQIIHSLDPNALVVSPTATDVGSGTWFANYFASSTEVGISPSSIQDVIAYHAYVGTDASVIVPTTASVRAAAQTAGLGSLPIWSDEGDWGPTVLTNDQQKSQLAQHYLYSWMSGLARDYWFIWNGKNAVGAWGLLWQPDTGEYPVATAYRQMHNWLSGAYGSANNCYQLTDLTNICSFMLANGNPAQILWNNSQTVSESASPVFTSYQTLDDTNQNSIVGNSVSVSSKPILIVNHQTAPMVASPSATNVPHVTYFSAPTSYPVANSQPTVPINLFSAVSQYSSLTGYMITDSLTQPAASDSRWSVAYPATFTFTGSSRTLYPWVKDAAGNVSPVLDAQQFAITVSTPQSGPINVYYSVGQSMSDLKTGSPTVTVSGNTATFSVAQTGNIGAGDSIGYGAGNVAYISGKLSSNGTKWSVVNAQGGSPVSASGAIVLSITRAFTSLASAFNGNGSYTGSSNVGDITHLNTYNLVSGNYILNLPCYWDGSPDTTLVGISDASYHNAFVTGPANYINVYTPADPVTEANFSQRHTGAWTANAFTLSTTSPSSATMLSVGANYARFTGLQIIESGTYDYAIAVRVATTSDSYIVFSDNIIHMASSGTMPAAVYLGLYPGSVATSYPTTMLSNNVIYGGWQGIVSYGTTYAYNNTIYGNGGAGYGFEPYAGSYGAGTVYAKNNIVQNILNDYSTSAGGNYDSSSTNNISSHTGAPGTNPQNSKTVSFVNAGAGDFHLSSGDTVALDHGADLTSDATYPFADDIDSQSRPYGSAWDIGADEYMPAASPSITMSLSATSVMQGSTVSLTANGTSNTPIISFVQFLIDGTAWGTSILNNKNLPYSLALNTAQIGEGYHTLTAQETDRSGGTSKSSALSLNVFNYGYIIKSQPSSNGFVTSVTTSAATPTIVPLQKTAVTNSPIRYARPLTIGSTGIDVSALQNFLIAQGYKLPSGATGYFGSQTRTALAAFQKSQGISPAVGYLGSLTQAVLNASSPAPVSTQTTSSSAISTAPIATTSFTQNLSLNQTGADVRALQQYLNTHGFIVSSTGAGSPGHETTLFGLATYRALVKFQKARSITPASGWFGPLSRGVVNLN